jgi:hypothetical protein
VTNSSSSARAVPTIKRSHAYLVRQRTGRYSVPHRQLGAVREDDIAVGLAVLDVPAPSQDILIQLPRRSVPFAPQSKPSRRHSTILDISPSWHSDSY